MLEQPDGAGHQVRGGAGNARGGRAGSPRGRALVACVTGHPLRVLGMWGVGQTLGPTLMF